MLILDAENRTRQSIQDHYDALCVELLGVRASGLSEDRVRELVLSGRLNVDALRGYNLGDNDEPLNPILFIRKLGHKYARAEPAERARMREYTIAQWQDELQGYTPPAVISYQVPISRPDAPDAPTPHQNAIPENYGTADSASLVSAFQSLGGYIRGLGSRYADEASADFFEEWDGQELLSTPDPQKRLEMLKVIREEVGAAVLSKAHAAEVARKMRNRTKDFARNFDRIAATELQAAHNEGQIIQAVELDGEGARVARIPESSACKYCLDAFLENGIPKIFEVSELIANGSNAGRKRSQWLPSAYPMHPNCRCDTIPVGKDQIVTRSGRIRKKASNVD